MTIVLRRFAAFAAISSVLFLSACGGGERPSVDEIKAGLSSAGADFAPTADDPTDEQLTCMAEALHDSDVSDEALRAMIDQDESYQESEEDKPALMAVMPEILKCSGVDPSELGKLGDG